MTSLLQKLLGSDVSLFFWVSLGVGAFVVFMYSLDQFGKPTIDRNGNDPWNFIPPPYLTPPQQYLRGFFFYCGTIILVFLAISMLGPTRTLEIVKSAGISTGKFDLKDIPTFPIVVAFFIIGVNPTLRLPSYLNYEAKLRRFAHRIAYIPKNMDTIFNSMMASDFDLSPQKVDQAWESVNLRRPTLDAPDLHDIRPLLDRTVVLYVLALKLAGEGEYDAGEELVNNLSLMVFRQYRERIEDIEINLQAAHARLVELNIPGGPDRKKSILTAKREIIKGRDFLYAIFACAITSKGMERISVRLRTLGFTSPVRRPPGVPWDPILRTIFAAAIVLAAALTVTSFVSLGTPDRTTPGQAEIPPLLARTLFVNFFIVVGAIRIRTRLIGAGKYYSEIGKMRAVAFVILFMKCAAIGFVLFSATYITTLIPLAIAAVLNTPQLSPPTEVIWSLLETFAVWAFVFAWGGTMTAYTNDWPSNRLSDKLVSGFVQGSVMAGGSFLANEYTSGGAAGAGLLYFYIILYGGLGFVIAFMLPAAIRAYWDALSNQLPDKVEILRTDVLQYFYSIQQFTEWLYMRNERLNGKRPFDVLAEETGLQQLTSFVAQTRNRVSSSAA